MKKRVLLPLFFFVTLGGCANGNISPVKAEIDHELALKKLNNYNQIVNLDGHEAPKTLKLNSTVDEFIFHETKVRNSKIELSVDTRYAANPEKETFPYAHLAITGEDEAAHIFGYESWVFVEARASGSVVNVYERGTEYPKNIRREYVFESKRDWINKASDSLNIMNEEIHGSAARISSLLNQKAKDGTIVSEAYDEPSAGGLIGTVSFLNDSLLTEEISFKFENFILQSYKHKKGRKANESEAKWDVESVAKDTPEPALFTLQNEGEETKAIR